MQNRNDEPRLQHAPPRLPRKDGGRGRVNRRAMGVGRVSEWRKVTSQNPAATSDSLNQRPRIEQSGRAATMNAIFFEKLQPMKISNAYGKALANGRRDGTGGLSPRTVHHMYRVLKQAMAQAVRWQLIVRNPLDAVDPPKVERQRLATYDVAQTAELLDAMRRTPMFIPTVLAVHAARLPPFAGAAWISPPG